MQDFILMDKDKPVASVSIQLNEDNEYYLHVNEVFDAKRLPYGTKRQEVGDLDKKFNDWNDSRCIPLGRPNLAQFREAIGVSSNAELIAKSHMCSLTDCFWFKETDSDKTWADVNFFDNSFSSNVYRHLFFNPDGTPINNLESPDLTTDGVLPKMWLERDGKFFLLKDSQGHVPMESYTEIFASKMLSQMGVEHVEYGGVSYKGRVVCKSENFIHSDKESFVSARDIMNDRGMQQNSEFFANFRKWGAGKEAEQMILCDYLLGNLDRHTGNYGFIVDSENHHILRVAPIFDNGAGDLFNDIGFMEYPPLGVPMDKVCQELSLETLQLVDKIDTGSLKTLLNKFELPEHNRAMIIDTLDSRIDKVREHIMERTGHDNREKDDRII